MTNSERATKQFPPQGEDNPLGIEYGDMIEYGANGVTVFIYARGYYNHLVVDGNVACYMSQVIRIVSKGAWLKV